MSLTYKRLREVLDYNPKTGVFTWRVRNGRSKMIAGSVAGALRPDGYRVIGIDYQLYRAAVLAFLYMTGEWPPFEVDHINTIPDDDRWCNLRPATHLQNMWNRSIRKNKNTPYKGVSFHKRRNKYRAIITINGRFIELGTFDNPETAHAVYIKAATRHFREFARAK